MLEHSDLRQMLAYASALNECMEIYERKKEELERYVSKDSQKPREEFVAETSKVLLDEVLKRLAGYFPEIKAAIGVVCSEPAVKFGELAGDYLKLYFQKNSVDNSGRQRSGGEVVKEFAYRCVKNFLLKRMLGD